MSPSKPPSSPRMNSKPKASARFSISATQSATESKTPPATDASSTAKPSASASSPPVASRSKNPASRKPPPTKSSPHSPVTIFPKSSPTTFRPTLSSPRSAKTKNSTPARFDSFSFEISATPSFQTPLRPSTSNRPSKPCDKFYNFGLPPRSLRCISSESQGEVAEWSNAPVLKTGGPQGPVGSNPTLSATNPRSGFPNFGCGMRTKFERREAAQTARSAVKAEGLNQSHPLRHSSKETDAISPKLRYQGICKASTKNGVSAHSMKDSLHSSA